MLKELADSLVKDAEKLAGRIKENKTSLVTLAADAGGLAYQFAGLRVDLIKLHEKKQRGE